MQDFSRRAGNRWRVSARGYINADFGLSSGCRRVIWSHFSPRKDPERYRYSPAGGFPDIASVGGFRHSKPMCGRFNVIDNPGLQQLLKDLGIDLQLPRAINIAPTEQVSVIRLAGGATEVASARWWLTPSWAKKVDQKYAMFNARSESLSTRNAYKKPFRSQRGIVPMSSFIEWQTRSGVKQPYDISTASGAMAAAALWDVWEGGAEPLLSCTLVTTAAPESFSPWHSRIPVLLTAPECSRWLDNTRAIADNDEIFRSELKSDWCLAPLDTAVGNSRLKNDALLEPVGELVYLAASTTQKE